MFKHFFSLLFIVIAAFFLSITSCSRQNKGEKPLPPDITTYEINFSLFNPSNTPQNDNNNSYENFLHANSFVTFWYSLRHNELYLPLLLLSKAPNEKTTYKGDKKGWRWKYEVEHNSKTYEVKLYATYQNDFQWMEWKMYVSQKEGFKDFLWMKGSCKKDYSTGQWFLYKSHDDQRPLVNINFEKNYTTGKRKITYTWLDSSTKNKNSYILWGNDNAPPYDLYYTIVNTATSATAKIEWSSITSEGRISDAMYYHDNLWHCWSNNLKNTTCN